MAGKLTPDTVMDSVDRIMSPRWEWGVTDCCMSGADVFRELHGLDLAADVRGTYSDAAGAAAVLRRYGGLFGVAMHFAQEYRLRPSAGRCGDIGISYQGAGVGADRRSILICVEPGRWAGKTECGYAIIDTAERAWSV